MAKERVIIRLRGMRTARVRYHRANLTIARSGDLNEGCIGQSIVKHEKGDIGAEELCWAFIKARVQSHTPSFSWEEAELTRVLRLVVSVSDRPEFASTETETVAAELVKAARQDAVELEGSLAKTRLAMENFLGGRRYDVLGNYSKITGVAGLDRRIKSLFDLHIAVGDHISRSIAGVARMDKFREVVNVGVAATRWNQLVGRDLARVNRTIAGTLNPKPISPPLPRALHAPISQLDVLGGRSLVAGSYMDAALEGLLPNRSLLAWRGFQQSQKDRKALASIANLIGERVRLSPTVISALNRAGGFHDPTKMKSLQEAIQLSMRPTLSTQGWDYLLPARASVLNALQLRISDTMRGLDVGRSVRRVLDHLERSRLWMLLLELRARFKDEPVIYVVEFGGVASAVAYLEYSIERGVDGLLDALTPVVSDPEFLEATSAAIDEAEHLHSFSRRWLTEGLRQVADNEDWVLALPHLFVGVEGAVRDYAFSSGLVDTRNRFTDKTGRSGEARGAEELVRVLDLPEESERLIRTRVYGTGNDFRHGNVALCDLEEDQARRQVVYLLLGLALWLEHVVDEKPRLVLAQVLLRETPTHVRDG